MTEPQSDRRSRSTGEGARRPLVFATGAVLLGLAVTLGIAVNVRADARDQARQRFEESATQSSGALEQDLSGYFDELRDIGSFVAASPSAEADQFERFVRGTGVFDRIPSLFGIIFLQRVAHDELDAFIEEFSSIHPEFVYLPVGEIVGEGDHYLLAYYVAGEIDLGLPIGADTTPIQAMVEVMEQGAVSGSGAAGSFQQDPFLQEIAAAQGIVAVDLLLDMDFFIGVPVYATPAADLAPPISEPTIGWVAAPVARFDEVLAAAAADLPSDLGFSLRVDLSLSSRTSDPLERVASLEGDAGPRDDAAFVSETGLEVEGVPFTLAIWSPETGDDIPGFVAIVLGGMSASVFAGAVVYLRLRAIERERAYTAAVAEREQFRRDILDSVTDAMVVLDSGGVVVSTNPAWSRLRARPDGAEADVGRAYLDAALETVRGDAGPLAAGLHAVLGGADDRPAVDVPVEVGGILRWMSVRFTRLRGTRGGAVALHTDITERKRSEAELELKATHDPLTGLLNRLAIEQELDRVLTEARLHGTSVGVLFIDLDSFKPINDTHGHAVGDEVLRAVSRRISSVVRTTDRVARLGGDEFLVVLAPLADRGDAERTATRVLEVLAAPIRLPTAELAVGASVGIAVADSPLDVDVARMIEVADRAMYGAKQEGGARFVAAP